MMPSAYLFYLLGSFSALADPRIALVSVSVWLMARAVRLLGCVIGWFGSLIKGADK